MPSSEKLCLTCRRFVNDESMIGRACIDCRMDRMEWDAAEARLTELAKAALEFLKASGRELSDQADSELVAELMSGAREIAVSLYRSICEMAPVKRALNAAATVDKHSRKNDDPRHAEEEFRIDLLRVAIAHAERAVKPTELEIDQIEERVTA